MARLLVDMNLSTEWIPLLRAAGHWAVHWSEVGDPRAPDTALMQWAIANCCAIFTHDLDFGTMLALSGANIRIHTLCVARIGHRLNLPVSQQYCHEFDSCYQYYNP
jgi:predicted nuclease of predicted toxin-antitoxin system